MIFIQDRSILDAIKSGDLSQVAHLLDTGANVNTKNEQVNNFTFLNIMQSLQYCLYI